MEANDAFARAATPFGEVGLLAPLVPDVTLMHALVADRAGNVLVHPPLLEGVWGALAARRGVIVTVEKIVDDVRPWSDLVRIPAHRVLAVVECPMGAHPGGLYTGAVPVDGYGEDYDFWVDARAATRAGPDEYDAWIKHWVLDVESQEQWVERLGAARVTALRAKADPESWRADAAAYPPDLDAPVNAWERAAVWGARHLAARVAATGADAVLRGCGRRQPRGVARRAARARRGLGSQAHGRDRIVGLRRDTGRPVRPEPPQLPDLDDARRRAGGARDTRRGYRDDRDRLPRRRPGRPLRQHQLDMDQAPAVPRRLGRRQRRGEHRGRERDRRDA